MPVQQSGATRLRARTWANAPSQHSGARVAAARRCAATTSARSCASCCVRSCRERAMASGARRCRGAHARGVGMAHQGQKAQDGKRNRQTLTAGMFMQGMRSTASSAPYQACDMRCERRRQCAARTAGPGGPRASQSCSRRGASSVAAAGSAPPRSAARPRPPSTARCSSVCTRISAAARACAAGRHRLRAPGFSPSGFEPCPSGCIRAPERRASTRH